MERSWFFTADEKDFFTEIQYSEVKERTVHKNKVNMPVLQVKIVNIKCTPRRPVSFFLVIISLHFPRAGHCYYF